MQFGGIGKEEKFETLEGHTAFKAIIFDEKNNMADAIMGHLSGIIVTPTPAKYDQLLSKVNFCIKTDPLYEKK